MDQERRIEYFMSEISRLSNQVVDLQYERDALAARLSEIEKSDSQEVLSLKADNQALAATVEAFGDKLSEVVALLDVDGMTAVQWLLDNCQEIESLLEVTPEQHLAELRAEAVERAIGLYTHKLGSDAKLNEVGIDIIKKYGEYIHPDGLREYVNQLRSRTDGEYSDSIRQESK